MQSTHLIQLFVDNQVGVLDQMSILVRRSGWNVRSIHACEEPARGGTRVILTIEGRADLRLLLGQFERLDCVRELSHTERADAHCRELALACSDRREALAETAARHNAHLLRSEPEGDTYELCGSETAVSQFLQDCVAQCGAKTMRSGAIHL